MPDIKLEMYDQTLQQEHESFNEANGFKDDSKKFIIKKTIFSLQLFI